MNFHVQNVEHPLHDLIEAVACQKEVLEKNWDGGYVLQTSRTFRIEMMACIMRRAVNRCLSFQASEDWVNLILDKIVCRASSNAFLTSRSLPVLQDLQA